MAKVIKKKVETKNDDLTLGQFLTNPSGKHTSFLSSRKIVIADLENRFKDILRRNSGKLPIKIYSDSKMEVIKFHIKIPSELRSPAVKLNLFYDTVFVFTKDKDETSVSSLYNYKMKFFSNSPSFSYTYAYVLNKMHMIPSFLKSKCNEKSITESPDTKNPAGVMGFEKTLYFASLYIKFLGLYKLGSIAAISSKLDDIELFKRISTADVKLQEYNKHKALITVKNRRNRKTIATVGASSNSPKHNTKEIKSMKRVKKVKSAKSVKRALVKK